jgi:hypothetical protein
MGNHSKDKKQLAFNTTYAEYALIKLMADKAGVNISEYLTGLLQDLYIPDRPEWTQPKRFGIYVEGELREAVVEEAMFENVTIGEFIKRKVLKDFDMSQK